MDSRIPQWFETEIAGGLTRLRALALPFSPSDELVLTIEVWAHGIWNSGIRWKMATPEGQDRMCLRIRHTFQTLNVESSQWPTPEQFLTTFSRLSRQTASDTLKLAEPEMSEEQKVAAEIGRRGFMDTVKRLQERGKQLDRSIAQAAISGVAERIRNQNTAMDGE